MSWQPLDAAMQEKLCGGQVEYHFLGDTYRSKIIGFTNEGEQVIVVLGQNVVWFDGKWHAQADAEPLDTLSQIRPEGDGGFSVESPTYKDCRLFPRGHQRNINFEEDAAPA